MPEASISKVASLLTAFLEAIHCAKIDSCWIMLLCDKDDRPESVEIPDDPSMNTCAVSQASFGSRYLTSL